MCRANSPFPCAQWGLSRNRLFGEGWGEEVVRASDDWRLGFPHPQGLGEQVPTPPPQDHDLFTTSPPTRLRPAMRTDRWAPTGTLRARDMSTGFQRPRVI